MGVDIYLPSTNISVVGLSEEEQVALNPQGLYGQNSRRASSTSSKVYL